ncbi:MAG: esterase-like activity of phytase family protein, partial [Actinomycetes bacterium]
MILTRRRAMIAGLCAVAAPAGLVGTRLPVQRRPHRRARYMAGPPRGTDRARRRVPADPEPEFVSINSRNQTVATLQENNHIVVVDLASGRVVTDFTAGNGTASGVDTVEDGTIRLDGTVTVPREPDGVSWLDDRYVATADEGDLVGGNRTWTVFDTDDGSVVYSSGAELDQLAARYGQYPEGRAENKGVKPEGIAIATYGRQRYVFVGMERANLVAVYRVTDRRRPELVQALPTGVGPEGLLPLPQRDALVVAAEEDSAG